jgi:acetamidase/formamidase
VSLLCDREICCDADTETIEELKMPVDLTTAFGERGSVHHLPATPGTVFWGYIDRNQPPVLEVNPGDIVEVEAVTHHSGDAPDLLMDDGVRAIWDAIAPGSRGPGPHILTGPIHIRGAEPGDTVVISILDMVPRLGYGANCAANWGLLYDVFGKERITIYELDGYGPDGGVPGGTFPSVARPVFGFDFTARPLYDQPGVISEPHTVDRQPFSRAVRVPVRPHFGVIGVAPADDERRSSVPPGVFGGNVDNWRFGPGATIAYPVFAPGANVFFGDPHFAQGDGEICGTAIEASLNARVQISLLKDLPIAAPLLQTDTHWATHGFGGDLDAAMRMAVEQALWLMTEHLGLSRDDAYSLASVALDLGVTQVVDQTLGCHAALARSIFNEA